MLPIFNEYQHATNMNNGCSKDRDREEKRAYSFRDLLIYTKWLRWSLWKSEPDGEEKDNKVYKGLVTFCQQLQAHFNIDTDYEKINNVISQSKVIMLRSCNPSYITDKEWTQVMMLSDDNSRRLYFALLVLCKFNRNNPVQDTSKQKAEYEDTRFKISMSIKDIYKYANIKFKREETKNDISVFYEPIINLQQNNLIESYFGKNKCTIVLKEADVNINTDDIYMTITQYDALDDYYRFGLKEERYKICPNCGRPFKSNKKNNNKYCKECTEKDAYSYHYIHCVDCGCRIKVSNYNTKTIRCEHCQQQYKAKMIQK